MSGSIERKGWCPESKLVSKNNKWDEASIKPTTKSIKVMDSPNASLSAWKHRWTRYPRLIDKSARLMFSLIRVHERNQLITTPEDICIFEARFSRFCQHYLENWNMAYIGTSCTMGAILTQWGFQGRTSNHAWSFGNKLGFLLGFSCSKVMTAWRYEHTNSLMKRKKQKIEMIAMYHVSYAIQNKQMGYFTDWYFLDCSTA